MSTLRLTTISNQSGSSSVPSDTVISGSAKAWVNFNGTGTVAIRASFNVSSITDGGTGIYTANFVTAMTDANYCVQVSSQYSTAVNAVNNVVSITTSVANIQHAENNALADSASIYVTIFR